MKYFSTLLIFIILIFNTYSQQDEYITVVGDSLVGRVINGETVREVFGHVVLTQGDVVITCKKAVQYLARNNR